MPIVTCVYLLANLAYMAVVPGDALLASPAVAVVRIFTSLIYIIFQDLNYYNKIIYNFNLDRLFGTRTIFNENAF